MNCMHFIIALDAFYTCAAARRGVAVSIDIDFLRRPAAFAFILGRFKTPHLTEFGLRYPANRAAEENGAARRN